MKAPAVKLGQGSYERHYCMIDEPGGDGLTFFVPVEYVDIEPVHWWARLLRWAADKIGGL